MPNSIDSNVAAHVPAGRAQPGRTLSVPGRVKVVALLLFLASQLLSYNVAATPGLALDTDMFGIKMKEWMMVAAWMAFAIFVLFRWPATMLSWVVRIMEFLALVYTYIVVEYGAKVMNTTPLGAGAYIAYLSIFLYLGAALWDDALALRRRKPAAPMVTP